MKEQELKDYALVCAIGSFSCECGESKPVLEQWKELNDLEAREEQQEYWNENFVSWEPMEYCEVDWFIDQIECAADCRLQEFKHVLNQLN